jgi:hypothetical protein
MQNNAHAWLSVSNIRGVVIKYLQISLIVSCVTKRLRRVNLPFPRDAYGASIHSCKLHTSTQKPTQCIANKKRTHIII